MTPTWLARVSAALLPSVASMDDRDDEIEVNCGRCGKKLLLRVEDIRDKLTIDCDECEGGRRAPRERQLIGGAPFKPEKSEPPAAFAFRQAIVFDAFAPGLPVQQPTASRDRIR